MTIQNFKFPDTGQTKSFNDEFAEIETPKKGEPFYGQDACFTNIKMSFTKQNKSGKLLPETATWADGLRVIKDENTGLFWEVKSPNKDDINYADNTYTWKESQSDYIENLNTMKYGGFSDWRSPNKEELRSIIDYELSSPSIDTLYFPNTKTGMYWSKEIYQKQPLFAWVLFFGVGSATAASISSKRYVRAVRGENFIEKENRLVDNNDGTITDTVTNLMWQKDENPRMSWYEALEYAQQQTIGDHKDWRLPNIKELNSILNLSYDNGWWYYKDFFPAKGLHPPLLHYFSSTVYEKCFVWVTNFCFGYDGYYANKKASLLFRLVRNITPKETEEKKFTLPETGQNRCYDTLGNEIHPPMKDEKLYGQNGNYKSNSFSYTHLRENGKAVKETESCLSKMVLDNNTGLIWETKSEKATDINYKGCRYTWSEAHKYIEKLNQSNYCGFKDWRLPNKEELRTIVNYNDIIPAVNQKDFPTIIPDFYWSKDIYKADEKLAWGIYFGYGCGICYERESLFYALAVRGGYKPAFGDADLSSFIDNKDGTVSDLNTHLMWKRDESPDMGFEEALAYCESLNLAGHDDWRLPNIREIATLLNLNYDDKAWFYKPLFPNVKTTPLGFYWSSTTFAATFGWGVNFQFGYDGYYADKIEGKYAFRPVRTIKNQEVL